jgi:methionyl-tRNA formyltransferase
MLQTLLASQHDVVAVLSQPDKPAGRGRKLTPSPVTAAARAAGLQVLQPESLRESLVQAQLQALAADLFIVVAYGQLLPAEVLAMPRVACVNLHASLLPRWRGASPIQTAVLHGDKETGVCLMKMDVGLDTGPVYSRVRCDIAADDTSATLHDRLAAVGAELLARELDEVLSGVAQPEPQAADGASYAPRINKADGQIDWQRSAAEIDCQIRAFNPWPVAATAYRAAPLRCWNSMLPAGAATAARAAPGTVLGVNATGLRVQTGAGELILTEVQQAGRKRVAALQFANTLPAGVVELGR